VVVQSIRKPEARGRSPSRKRSKWSPESATFDYNEPHHHMAGGVVPDPVQERTARRPPAGGYDDRCAAGVESDSGRVQACSTNPQARTAVRRVALPGSSITGFLVKK
jgi:hypothetical protein